MPNRNPKQIHAQTDIPEERQIVRTKQSVRFADSPTGNWEIIFPEKKSTHLFLKMERNIRFVAQYARRCWMKAWILRMKA